MKLLRTELSVLSFNLLELRDSLPIFSHLSVSHRTAMPDLSPKPPDPPDLLCSRSAPSTPLLFHLLPPQTLRSKHLFYTSLVCFVESSPSDRISISLPKVSLSRPENLLSSVSNPVLSVRASSPAKILKIKLLCILSPPSINGLGSFLCSRSDDGFLGKNPVDLLYLELGVNCLILNLLLWNDPTIFSSILSYISAVLHLNISFATAWYGPVLFSPMEAQSFCFILYFRTVLNLVEKIFQSYSSLAKG